MFKLGIDLGGTKTEGICLDETGRELFRERVPTPQAKGYNAILDTLSRLYTRMQRAIDAGEHSLGIGTPGSLSPKTNLIRNSNTLCLNGRPLHADLEAHLGHLTLLENDANCFALAEARLGNARGYGIVFGIILGTGCGGGIIIREHIHRGRLAIGGEWGHTVLDPRGPGCYCGKKGCVETFISGGGLEKQYSELFHTSMAARGIFAAGNASANKMNNFLKDFYDRFGLALANVINILDPDCVVIGGGLSSVSGLYTTGRDCVAKYIFGNEMNTPILPNRLGDSAGVIGAALLAEQQ